MKIWKTIGLMSGSSLDGLDIAYAEFWKDQTGWQYSLLVGETIEYSYKWHSVLKNIRNYSEEKLMTLHFDYGKLLGELTNNFIAKHNLKPELIASHGHTVFHNPEKGYTFQLGAGEILSEITNITTITNFRIPDILQGGNGAPLVPIGDELLFSEYKACLNIGGIANISFIKNKQRVAFDVCPANQLLNHLAAKKGLSFDENGRLASGGKVLESLYQKLAENPFYFKLYPKSLSNEYVAESFIPLIDRAKGTIEDKLHTVSIHIADQLYKATLLIERRDDIYRPVEMDRTLEGNGKILVTGGGAFNRFLMEALEDIAPYSFTIPDTMLVNYKEALVFALMGVLKINGEINCLASATGARSDSSAGTVYEIGH